MNFFRKFYSSGFTLIELLIVIVIIGILAGIGLGSFMSTQRKARDARRKEDLTNITRALEVYLNDTGAYPLGGSVGGEEGKIIGCGDSSSPNACDWGSTWKDDKDTYYMVQIPNDPSIGRYYYYESDGSYYVLYALLENLRDSGVPRDSSDNPQVYYRIDDALVATNCSGDPCNYAEASSNVADLNEI